MTAFWRRVCLESLILASLGVLAAAPFREAIREPGNVPLGLDLSEHYSREASNRRAFRETWIPLWNPYEFAGFPVQADPVSGIFYPPNVFLRMLSLPRFFTWTVVFHIWLFGAGSYVLSRTMGARPISAAVSAAGLMLGGITMGRVYAGHFEVLRTLAWIPLALAAAIRSIDRESMRPTFFAVLVLSLEVLAGFLQLFAYTVGAIALYAVFCAVWPRIGDRSWMRTRLVAIHFLVLIVLALGMTAFQLLPTSRLIRAAGRTQGIPYDYAARVAIDLRDLPSLMFTPVREGALPKESWESSAYIGWLTAALAPLALLASGRRRIVAFFVILAGLALALAAGEPVYRLHYLTFPMFRIPGRLMCFWAISLSVLGAIGLDWLTDMIGRRRSSRTQPWLVVVIPLVAGVVVALDGSGYARHFVRVGALQDRFVSSIPFTPTAHGRVLSMCEDRVQTSELTAMGVASVDGYNSFFLMDYAHLAERARAKLLSSELPAFLRIGAGRLADLAAVNALNVTEILSCDPIPLEGLDVIRQDDRFYLYRNTEAFGRAAARCVDDPRPLIELSGTCNEGTRVDVLAADTPKGLLRLRVSLLGARTLVLAEPYYPERRAWIDGVEAPIEKANMALSAVGVGGGEHLVEIRYVPTALRWGTLISVSVLLAALVAAVMERRTR